MTSRPALAGVSAAAPEAPIDVAAYLARIGYHGWTRPTLPALAGLHLAHMRTVPFENLDIVSFGRPISLQPADLFEKIVRRRRGGFCFELNGLFAVLLRQLGFRVTLRSATFPRPPGEVGPAFDHLALVVETEGDDGPWLADVGAGRGSSGTPLPMVPSQAQFDPTTNAWFRFQPEEDGLRLLRRDPAGPAPDEWERQYLMAPLPRRLDDFSAGVHFHQTSPSSPFTQHLICSRLTPTGRITLSNRRLITTSNGRRDERELADEQEVRTVLRTSFGIEDGPA
jgi:N-hydroxyarylamine O-acetyltransferase